MRCTFANKERERERERESKEMKERKVSWKMFWKDISIYESRYKKNIPLRDEIIFHFLLFFLSLKVYISNAKNYFKHFKGYSILSERDKK